MNKIVFYFEHTWHCTNSPAINYIIIDPIKEISEVPVEIVRYDQNNLLGFDNCSIIFPLLLPGTDSGNRKFNIPLKKTNNYIWMPMYDCIQGYGDKYLEELDKDIKILVCGNEIENKCIKYGFRYYKYKYYHKCDNINSKINWEKRIMYYWNRLGIYSKDFIYKLCKCLNIDELIYQYPIYKNMIHDFNLPEFFDNTRVTKIDNWIKHDNYLDLISRSNIFLSPRFTEGVGVTMLENLSKGCCVFSIDRPVMNEYISHMQDGYLFNSKGGDIYNELEYMQDWKEIEKLDLRKLGNSARYNHMISYDNWKSNLVNVYEFLVSNV